jgi:signal transduction histidine kinase
MKRHLGLRWKILLFTVLPLAALAVASLGVVHRTVARQVQTGLHDDLRRAAQVLETVLGSRARELGVDGQVIVQDPRFFSVLTLPGTTGDPELRATVSGVARDFNEIVETDLFEVMDGDGNLVASVGRASSGGEERTRLVLLALTGRPVSAILLQSDGQFQVAVTPVVAGGRIVGVLLLGSRIGRDLALQFEELTRSHVSFVSDTSLTATTLDRGEDRRALLDHLLRAQAGRAEAFQSSTVFEIRGGGQRMLTLARQLPGSELGRRQLYVMQRSLDAEGAFLRETQLQLIQLGVALVLLALVAGFVISERITSPVRRLVRGAEEMERGNYDYPIEVGSLDEIGYLTSRFKEMRQQQRAYVRSLQDVARVKSEFISVASHELRTPISIIKGFQELMQRGVLGPVSEQQAQALEAVGRSCSTLARIAEDATRMAQIDGERLVLHLADADLLQVLDSAVHSAREAGPGRDVEVHLDAGPSLGAARVDGARLSLAVANIVRNGIRFTPDGGRVDVRGWRDRGALVIEVRDNGVGMTAEQRSHLFDRALLLHDSLNHHSSSTLAFNSAGLGLGLSIARGIVEAHGGSIEVESEPGLGSTFVIRIPLNATPRMEAAA